MPYRDLTDPIDFRSVSIVLITMNVLGIVLGYCTTILLARNLTHERFELYVTAVSTLGILSVLGEAGFGKYALRIVPALRAENQPGRLRSYLMFALAGTGLVSTLLACATAGVESYVWMGESGDAIQSALLMLPIVACAAVAVDLWLSLGYAITGTMISRIVIPATTLLLLAAALSESDDGSGLSLLGAIACFGAGSFAALVASSLGYLLVARFKGDAALADFRLQTESNQTQRWTTWILPSLSYMVFYFMIAWLSRSTLFLAGHLPHTRNELAILTPAFETGCLVLVLSKATDKFFQPAMSGFLETEQFQTLKNMHRSRIRILGVCVVLFLSTIVIFGKQILSLYGERFVDGYPTLCLISIGSGLWTMCSLMPSFLLYAGSEKLLSVLLGIHCIASLVLIVILFPSFGAIGAASAYTLTVTSFGICNLYFARRRLTHLSHRSNLP